MQVGGRQTIQVGAGDQRHARRGQGRDVTGLQLVELRARQALFRFMDELDRVFDSQDVAVFFFVLVIHHRRQRGGFAGAGRPGDQHQSARLVGQFLENIRGLEIFQRQNLGRNGPQHGRRTTILYKSIDPEAGQIRHGKGKVALQIFFVGLALTVVHHVVDHGMHVLVLHGRQIDTPHVAIDADHGRHARRQVKIGSLVLDDEGQQFGDVHCEGPLEGCDILEAAI